MPVIASTYKPATFLKNGHLATIIPNKLRKIEGIKYSRKRVELNDGDFVDLDFSKVSSSSLVLILHGLEGSSDRAYARAMVKECNHNNLDACVFNQRSCSGEINRLFSSYHSGKSDDLKEVLNWIKENHNYQKVYLVGYSLGGNIILKFLGETADSGIEAAVAISAPVDLKSSALALAKKSNYVYMRRFLKSLRIKTLHKMENTTNPPFKKEELFACKNFLDFDNLYTAPIHGFKNAEDYWARCSSKQQLLNINTRTLLLTSKNDPFLGKNCYPFEEAKNNSNFSLEVSNFGGHVGFIDRFPLSKPQFLENRSLSFLTTK